jgi:hypothetical protein
MDNICYGVTAQNPCEASSVAPSVREDFLTPSAAQRNTRKEAQHSILSLRGANISFRDGFGRGFATLCSFGFSDFLILNS